MSKQLRNNFLKTLTGLFMFSVVLVACNNSTEEKKDDAPPADTTATVAPIDPAADTMNKAAMDTADTRPVKPTE